MFQDMETGITRFLNACKDTFAGVCGNFAFFKFHMIKHCPDQCRAFGNLMIICANRYML